MKTLVVRILPYAGFGLASCLERADHLHAGCRASDSQGQLRAGVDAGYSYWSLTR
jgi:hypothetical protein